MSWTFSQSFLLKIVVNQTLFKILFMINLTCSCLCWITNFIFNSRIVQALEFIHQNYNQQIEIEELSNRLHLDNSYFIRLFKKYMRVSPFQYLKDYRLSMAISLLKAGNKVSDVAEMVGYSSVHAFSNAVKKNMGISPSQLNQFY